MKTSRLETVRSDSLNGCKERAEESNEESKRGSIIVSISSETHTKDYGDERKVGSECVSAGKYDAIDENCKDRSCSANDLVEGDSDEISERGQYDTTKMIDT